jgi:hypothetical protein
MKKKRIHTFSEILKSFEFLSKVNFKYFNSDSSKEVEIADALE